MIRNIKQLKEIIKDLPDDMEVAGYNGGNGDLVAISHWISEPSKEQIEAEPNLVKTFVISTD